LLTIETNKLTSALLFGAERLHPVELPTRPTEWDNGDYERRTPEEIGESQRQWNLFRDGAPNEETPAQISERVDRLIPPSMEMWRSSLMGIFPVSSLPDGSACPSSMGSVSC